MNLLNEKEDNNALMVSSTEANPAFPKVRSVEEEDLFLRSKKKIRDKSSDPDMNSSMDNTDTVMKNKD